MAMNLEATQQAQIESEKRTLAALLAKHGMPQA